MDTTKLKTITDALTAVQSMTGSNKQLGGGSIPGLPPNFQMPFVPPIPIHQTPKWLVFKNEIFNTENILMISKKEEGFHIALKDGSHHIVSVNNMEEQWKKLQRVFTFGATEEDNGKVSTTPDVV